MVKKIKLNKINNHGNKNIKHNGYLVKTNFTFKFHQTHLSIFLWTQNLENYHGKDKIFIK